MHDCDLSTEVRELRQEVRNLRIGFVCLLALVLPVGFLSGAMLQPNLAEAQERTAKFDKIRAGQIEIVDSGGRVVRLLGVYQGNPMDTFLDKEGRHRLGMGILGNTSSLFVYSPSREAGIVLVSGPDDEAGNEIVTGVGVMDTKAKTVWAVRQSPRLGMIEMMKDPSGTIRMAAHVNSQGSFKYHVQKSALEQVGEFITWAGRIKALTK